jgi:chromate transporter
MKELVWYFLKLGSTGFGGPAALVGYMRRDLVEDRKLIDESTYNLSIALAQIMPGPLAAQTAMAIGFFQGGVLGATLVGLTFILPSFLMVLGLSALYVAYGGMPSEPATPGPPNFLQSVFYGIGAVIIAIIAVAAYRLARGTNKRDPLMWMVFAVMLAATAWTGTELATLFLVAGLIVLFVRAWPGRRRAAALMLAGAAAVVLILLLEHALTTSTASDDQPVLLQVLLFFTKAGSFVFGSGLAIVPFLQQGVVHDMAWLNEHQFLDAVAVALITPGPVVITVAFIGYLVAGVAGATLAAIGIFLPVYCFTILPAPWFRRHRDNPQLRAFAAGATAAASGAIAGAVIVLGRGVISDVPTAGIALAGLVLLARFRVPEPLLVLGAGAAGFALSRQ